MAPSSTAGVPSMNLHPCTTAYPISIAYMHRIDQSTPNSNMGFSSESSRSKSKLTVNKLFESMLPGTAALPAARKNTSSTEHFHKAVAKKNLSKEAIRKANKLEKLKKNKAINKALARDHAFAKQARHNVIKNHKENRSLTEEEQKYLNKLIKKNSALVRRTADVDDPAIKDEIQQLRAEILALTNEKYVDSKARTQAAKLLAFKEKIAKGKMSYPGLTPGLAPVGLDDEDSDED